MSIYYRREWDEARGDECDVGGTSTWFFEVDADGYPSRQVQVYADGTVLRYDTSHSDDEFGGLGDQILDREEFRGHEVSREVFDAAWARGRARNRP